MRFFSKFVFICNICFVIMAVMNRIEKHQAATGKPGELMPLPYIKGTLVVLGSIAILASVAFILMMFAALVLKKAKQIPRWMVIFNAASLLAEIYWYFIDKS